MISHEHPENLDLVWSLDVARVDACLPPPHLSPQTRTCPRGFNLCLSGSRLTRKIPYVFNHTSPKNFSNPRELDSVVALLVSWIRLGCRPCFEVCLTRLSHPFVVVHIFLSLSYSQHLLFASSSPAFLIGMFPSSTFVFYLSISPMGFDSVVFHG
jgi:hypothetical protein